ncbi:hypothetical protein BGZ98_001946 [Dissophora globulifera]|nr:hypothetical protein BGZ98_001946 [Dissophora globulifera]
MLGSDPTSIAAGAAAFATCNANSADNSDSSSKPTLTPEVAHSSATPFGGAVGAQGEHARGDKEAQGSPHSIHPDIVGTQPRRESEIELAQNDLVPAIQVLSTEDTLKEEERVALKIKQMMRPISRLQALGRSTFQNRHHDSPNPSEHAKSHPPSVDQSREQEIPQSSSQLLDKGTVARIPEDNGAGTAVASASGSPKPRFRSKSMKKEPSLVEVDLPQLVDAETQPGDRRFFRSPADPEPEGDFVYDFLYQHQRGAFFLGTPKFSSKSLLPVDPDEWTDQNFATSAMDTTDYVVPDPSWEWVHKSWLVDMTGDVDEDGWEYAIAFHGSPWHGNYEVFRSFARRRRWLRLRKRKGKLTTKLGPLPERSYPSSIDPSSWSKIDVTSAGLSSLSPFTDSAWMVGGEQETVDLYKLMAKAPLDRERLACAAQYAVWYPGKLDDIERRLDGYLNLLDYETSRREFLNLMAAYAGPGQNAFRQQVGKLQFYSDRKMMLPEDQE